MDRFSNLSVYASFMGVWNPEMTSQSKQDPFSCIVVHRPKKRPTHNCTFELFHHWHKVAQVASTCTMLGFLNIILLENDHRQKEI